MKNKDLIHRHDRKSHHVELTNFHQQSSGIRIQLSELIRENLQVKYYERSGGRPTTSWILHLPGVRDGKNSPALELAPDTRDCVCRLCF